MRIYFFRSNNRGPLSVTTVLRTLLSLESLYSTHRPMDFLQYSMVNASVNSCPWPLPHRPCVSVHVTKWSSSKSISRYSLTSLLIWAFGHHAPPFFSWRILKQTTGNVSCYNYRDNGTACAFTCYIITLQHMLLVTRLQKSIIMRSSQKQKKKSKKSNNCNSS